MESNTQEISARKKDTFTFNFFLFEIFMKEGSYYYLPNLLHTWRRLLPIKVATLKR